MVKEIRKKIENYLSTKRLLHTFNVEKIATEIARKYEVDETKIAVASLLHDIAKDIRLDESLRIIKDNKLEIPDIYIKNPDLIHSFLGAFIASSEFGIDDTEILDSIRYHTLGKENMGIIPLIVYIADFIDPNKEVEKSIKNLILKEALSGYIYRAALLVCVEKIKYVVSEMKYMDTDTVFFYNFLCENEKKCLLPSS